jgi:hypothetical protein
LPVMRTIFRNFFARQMKKTTLQKSNCIEYFIDISC